MFEQNHGDDIRKEQFTSFKYVDYKVIYNNRGVSRTRLPTFQEIDGTVSGALKNSMWKEMQMKFHKVAAEAV